MERQRKTRRGPVDELQSSGRPQSLAQKAQDLAGYPGLLDSPREYDLATVWAKENREDTDDGVRPVFDRDSFWRYSDQSGTWSQIPTNEMLCDIMDRFHSRPYKTGDEKKPVKYLDMTQRKATAVYKILTARLFVHRFFDDAPAGALGFSDGVYLRRGEKIEYDGKCFEHRLRVGYDFGSTEAESTQPEKFLDLLDVVLPIKDLQDFLQAYLGACLFGVGYRLQKACILIGEGANGKSTFLQVIEAAFPQDSVSHVSPHAIEKDHFKAIQLDGRLVNLVDESPTAELAQSHEFKKIITGDPVTGRRPYGQDFTFRPRAGHIFSANEPPSTSDHTEGYWRRLVPIPFTVRIPEGKRDPNLADMIISSELPAVVGWLIEGARKVAASGWRLRPLEESARIIEQWKTSSDSVRGWIDEEMEIGCGEHKKDWYPMRTAYDKYADWAKLSGYRAVGYYKFRKRLEFCGVETAKQRVTGRWVVDLSEKPAAPDPALSDPAW